jgi:class 3 adenylate cyclase
LDLEAVADRLGLERFDLYAFGAGTRIAIAYAVRHSEQVSRLVLVSTFARGSEFLGLTQTQAVFGLMEKDWELFTETAARWVVGWADEEMAREMAGLFRECVTQEAALAAYRAVDQFDSSSLLGRVRSPTLVIHVRQFPIIEVGVAQGLASRIPDARLAVVEDTESAIRAADEFGAEGEETKAKMELPEGMAVILFADIVESTALTEQLGDAAFRDKARELDTSLRGVIRECAGTPVEGKLLGDGVLAVFTSARQAIECALRCNAASEPLGLQLHLGIHAGDVIREGNNVYGGAVNIAARIATASAPGEVLVSDTVRGLARTSAGVAFDDRGEQSLKGVGEPQRLFAVRGGG